MRAISSSVGIRSGRRSTSICSISIGRRRISWRIPVSTPSSRPRIITGRRTLAVAHPSVASNVSSSVSNRSRRSASTWSASNDTRCWACCAAAVPPTSTASANSSWKWAAAANTSAKSGSLATVQECNALVSHRSSALTHCSHKSRILGAEGTTARVGPRRRARRSAVRPAASEGLARRRPRRVVRSVRSLERTNHGDRERGRIAASVDEMAADDVQVVDERRPIGRDPSVRPADQVIERGRRECCAEQDRRPPDADGFRVRVRRTESKPSTLERRRRRCQRVRMAATCSLTARCRSLKATPWSSISGRHQP